ncbi:unnamed protein product [Lepidochelys kempii]
METRVPPPPAGSPGEKIQSSTYSAIAGALLRPQGDTKLPLRQQPGGNKTLSPTAVPTGTRGALLRAGISRCCCYPSWNTSTDWHAGERFLRSRQGRCRVTRVPATRGDFPMAQAGGAAFRPCRCPRRAASPPPPKPPRVPHASGQVSTAPRQRLAPEQR